MWSSRRLLPLRALLLALALPALSGCGFEPVYGPDSPATALRDRVELTAPETVDGYRLRARLEERLGRPEAATHTLDLGIEIARERVAVGEDGTVTRFTLPGTATYTLRDVTGAMTQGTVSAFTSYSTTGTTVATRAAETDARARLAVILADLIVTRLIALPAP